LNVEWGKNKTCGEGRGEDGLLFHHFRKLSEQVGANLPSLTPEFNKKKSGLEPVVLLKSVCLGTQSSQLHSE
jgi:hypothetical protein